MLDTCTVTEQTRIKPDRCYVVSAMKPQLSAAMLVFVDTSDGFQREQQFWGGSGDCIPDIMPLTP